MYLKELIKINFSSNNKSNFYALIIFIFILIAGILGKVFFTDIEIFVYLFLSLLLLLVIFIYLIKKDKTIYSFLIESEKEYIEKQKELRRKSLFIKYIDMSIYLIIWSSIFIFLIWLFLKAQS